MARIRSIKPEFPQSETVGSLSRDARLLFIQLWTLADDVGRARASSRVLASLLYPFDDDAKDLIGGWLDELEAKGCIRRYAADGNSYLDIPNWLKHQKIDHAGKSHIPEFSETLAKPRETLAPDLGPRTLDLGPRTEENAREGALAFLEFWQAFPNKVGKTDAAKAFIKVQKSGKVSHGDLMAALRKYAAKTDDRPWCNPATWLRQGRWEDNPTTVGGPAQVVRDLVNVLEGTEEMEAWDRHWRQTKGVNAPRSKHGGIFVETQWPPGEPNAESPTP